MESISIRIAYVWRVFDWSGGRWCRAETVQTWTRDHALACQKARVSCPARVSRPGNPIASKFKVEFEREDDISALGMTLSRSTVVGKDWPAWRCVDLFGEFDRLSK